MKFTHHYCSLLVLLITGSVYAQSNILNATTPDEIGIKNIDQLQDDMDSFLEYEFVDDREILWSKIVYEKIDLNERLNFPLLFPITDDLYENTRKSLWRVLKENILNGNITKVYNSRNDNFRDLMPNEEIIESVKTELDFGDGEIYPAEIGSGDITSYNIKGMWYFDKRRGELMYRLLGIQPIGKNIKDPDDEVKKTELFWIWYPSIREILHTELVFNDTSNTNRISFDQLLLSRRFSSYIYKEDNLFNDRKIEDYKRKGLNYILESQRIKDEILNFEQDLWNR
jgi:gliding motility associated protien GldN|tara:strand:- start:344 stop:1195 length:852 start_codon:yes stop_codon:yes gene_type:complete